MKTNLTPLNTINEPTEILSFSDMPKSVILIDDNELDNFVNHKILENYGVKNIMSFSRASMALAYLEETSIKYQLILVGIYLPIINGFEFIDIFYKLNLHKKHGEICLLSASLDPSHKQKSAEKNIRFIEKPLKINNLLQKI